MIKKVVIKMTGYGRQTTEVTFDHQPTFSEALEAAHWELAPADKAYVDGVAADLEDELQNGDTVQIVGNKEGGLK